MSANPPSTPHPQPAAGSDLVADRRRKLTRLREEFGIDPYGQRVDGLISIADARAAYDAAADEAHKADATTDNRPAVSIAGRIVLHRDSGKLVFMKLRDASGDVQVAVSKAAVDEQSFKLAKLADLGDIAVASGRLGTTKTGEVTVWASAPPEVTQASAEALGRSVDACVVAPSPAFQIATKSLAPPPEKFHGLADPELRYRKRYVDLYANPEVMQVALQRAKIVKAVRDFFTGQGFLEVETPMMQPIPGGAAARPFITHHNALDIDLYLRIAPELYLKRLLVGGMPKVFEINRNFRNEGIDRSHNPEFTMLELYEAFGDLYSVMQLTEDVFKHVAQAIHGSLQLPYGHRTIDYSTFRRASYFDLFEQVNGFPGSDHIRVKEKARELHIDPKITDPDELLNAVWEETVEATLVQPTFVIDYPRKLCPLTKAKPGDPTRAERFELFIASMELANAYTELNDPDVQEANFRQQVHGAKDDEEQQVFRNVDEDFLESLRVGMPPAGGLGIGIDRLIMLMTNQRSIRDVILFPLMKPQ